MGFASHHMVLAIPERLPGQPWEPPGLETNTKLAYETFRFEITHIPHDRAIGNQGETSQTIKERARIKEITLADL
jgi:hypothetical protein